MKETRIKKWIMPMLCAAGARCGYLNLSHGNSGGQIDVHVRQAIRLG